MKLMRWLGCCVLLNMAGLQPVYATDLLDDRDKMLNQQIADAPEWEESQAKLPAAPKDENLVAFYVSGIAGNQY
ncbi:MAG: CNP1-like family protein, partial [Sulfuriferula sp.]